jgi:hypothetical protein
MQKSKNTAAITRYALLLRRTSFIGVFAALAGSFPFALAQPTVLQSTPAKPAVLQLLPEPQLQQVAPEVIINPNPATSETNATKIRPANNNTLEFGYVPPLSIQHFLPATASSE